MRMASPGFDRLCRGMPGGDAIDDRETYLAAAAKIVAAHGKTVDRGIIERRNIDGRDDVVGEHAAQSFAQRHRFTPIDRRDALDDQALGLGNRKQRAVESKAIVAQLRH